MEGLANPNYKNVIVTKNGYNNDIIKTLNSQFPEAVNQVKNVRVSGVDEMQKGRAIFNYLKYSVNYRKDEPGKQVIQLPARMIKDTKKGDCKSKALAAAALMHNNGFKNVALRYTSYDVNDKTPTHVYAVGYDGKGKEIIIDPVWKAFNTQAPYKFKKDYPMEISVISGTPTSSEMIAKRFVKKDPAKRLNALLNKVRPGGVLHNVIVNEMARMQGKSLTSNYSSDQLQRYKKFLLKVSQKSNAPVLRDLITKEIRMIDNGAFSGNIYLPGSRKAIKGLEEEIGKISLRKIGQKLNPAKAFKAAKAVAFFPTRKAFLLLVTLNVRGLAKRLSKLSAIAKKNFWENKFGGKMSVLDGAIKRGLRKKPLFGASKKVKAIKGIGYVIDQEGIGKAGLITKLGAGAGAAGGAAALASGGAAANPAGGASIATIIAAAAPILAAVAALFKKEQVAELPEAMATSESSDFKEVASEGNTGLNKLETFVEKAADTAVKLGVIPEPKETGAVTEVNNMVGSDTPEETVAEGGTDRTIAPNLSTIPMPIIIGGAALLGYAILKGRKK